MRKYHVEQEEIVQGEVNAYTGKGLNGYSYLGANPDQLAFLNCTRATPKTFVDPDSRVPQLLHIDARFEKVVERALRFDAAFFQHNNRIGTA